ncbi:hypothetical protein [Bacillus badius]|uniref:Uncharacterized protein n=1 Tax=Bacillus badius TaxID=1455 RepID=A0ABR5AZU0_BACBA|nr:hypothetical protein [Bacillus badius]KIL73248.1 hypothetical protein SD78_3436 [Bacillus badius]KIL80260.1 hypothetical protein SD77_0108 [Bacillus badius]KZO00745.1 hypothetical protein A4244_02480 [Bacillus badius]MED0667024.1 hypothetical protein [Bacillus badius]MED4716968.1 hypothetical protein [Bacillus badius]
METLTEREQVTLAYYVQYYLGNDPNDIAELHRMMTEGMPSYPSIMEQLTREGMLNGMDAIPSAPVENGGDKITIPMITHKGILYIDSILNIQSYAVEGNKLSYIKNSLLTNNLQLSVDVIAAYVKEETGIPV